MAVAPDEKKMRSTVGASLLAKVVNDDVGVLDERGALGFFASKLAPTGVRCQVLDIRY
jgi:hypothetical protein